MIVSRSVLTHWAVINAPAYLDGIYAIEIAALQLVSFTISIPVIIGSHSHVGLCGGMNGLSLCATLSNVLGCSYDGGLLCSCVNGYHYVDPQCLGTGDEL